MGDKEGPPKKRPIDASKDQEQAKQKKIEFERISAEELQRRTADEADKSTLRCVLDRCSSKLQTRVRRGWNSLNAGKSK